MARKFRLREFHEAVVARLQHLQSEDAQRIASKLGAAIGGSRWLLDLGSIGEVVAAPKWVPVPMTRPWYLGVANIRGNLYGVADLSLFLGSGATPQDPDNRLVLMHPRYGINCGLLVRRIHGLRNPEQFKLLDQEGLPPYVSGRYADSEGAPWQELDCGALAARPEFTNIALHQRRNVFANVLQQT